MKKFNIAVVLAWFGIFICSLHPVPQDREAFQDEPFFFDGLQTFVVVQVNETVWHLCGECTEPDSPFAVETKTAGVYNVDQLTLMDERMTQVILRKTFGLVLFFVLFANLVAFCVKGPSEQLTNQTIAMRDGFIRFLVVVVKKFKRQRLTKQDEQNLYDGSM